MFDEIGIAASIEKVTVSAKAKDGVVLRMCRVTLAREFDDLIASALKGDARKALSGLRDGGMSKVVLPIDSIRAEAKFIAMDDRCTVPVLKGIKAVGEAPEDEDDVPHIKLEFEFVFSTEAWIFLGRNVAGVAQVTFRKTQEEFAFAARGKVVEINTVNLPSADDEDGDEAH